MARSCFTRDILPVIISRCASTGCHDANAVEKDLVIQLTPTMKSSVTPGNPGQ